MRQENGVRARIAAAHFPTIGLSRGQNRARCALGPAMCTLGYHVILRSSGATRYVRGRVSPTF